MKHPLSSLPNTKEFVHEGIPMRYFVGHTNRVRDLATRFSPLIIQLHDRFEIDWKFYAGLPANFQEMMNEVLLSLGVLTPEASSNIRVAPKKTPLCKHFMPKVVFTKLYFSIDRIPDALSYISHAAEIFRWHGRTVAPADLVAEQLPDARIEHFNCNAVKTAIVITGESRIAV